MTAEKTKVLIVGGGKGGTALIDLLHDSEAIEIAGVVDVNQDAPGIKSAQYFGVPTGSDYKEFLGIEGLCEIINVTGSEKVQQDLLAEKPSTVEVIGGHSAKLLWGLITEQKKTKEDLKEAKKYSELIFKVTPSAIFTVNKDKIVTSWNRKAEEVTGYSDDEIVGRECMLFADEPCKNKCGLYSDDVKKPVVCKECTIRRKDGKLRVISKNADTLKDGYGNVTGGIESFEDITEKKEREREVKSAYLQINQIFQGVSEGMCLIDKDFRMIRVNKAFLDLVGFREGQVLGMRCSEVLAKDLCKTPQCPLKRIIKGEEHVEMDVNIEKKGGIRVPCILTAMPLRDADGNLVGIIESFKDITERKSAETTLLENIRLKSNFTSMVSHELRTPLTAIKEGIGIVLDGAAGEINEEQKDFLDTAKRNVDRLTRLINDVLDFTKLQSGKMFMKIAENDIGAMIKEVVKTQMPVAKEKGLYLKTEIVPGIPKVQFDHDRIIQVLINLVNNALKFTEKGGITVSAYLKSGSVSVSVDDTGPGIKEADLPKVFQEFRQIEDAKTRKAGGSGLGLDITKEIVARHGGRIWAESQYGKGSSFKFTLPLERKYKVVVLDDEPTFLSFSEKVLEQEGCEVIKAQTGAEGIRKIREERPDLVVLDMVLPDLNGYEIIGRMNSEKELASIPILAVSGYAEKLKELDKIEVPDERFTIPKLMKPVEPALLAKTVKDLLRQRS